MILGGEESVELEVEGIKLEQLKSFKYLGAQIQNNGKQEAEINEKIGTAMKIYYKLNINFQRMRTITEKTKVNVYKAIFCLILSYGCESWVLTKDIGSRIQVAESENKRDYEKRQRRDEN